MKRDGFIGRMGRRFESGTRSLLSSAGKAEGAATFEALEPRVLLAADGALSLADAPGLDDVFPDSGVGAIPFDLDTAVVDPSGIDPTTGLGAGVGGLDSDDLDDFWRFTTTDAGFVSVLASAADRDVLDTQIEIYLPDGTEITTDNQGFSNGNLARGFDSDGWFGFVAEANQEYYVRVVGQNADTIDPSSPAEYTLQINTANEVLPDLGGGVFRTGSDLGDARTIGSTQADLLFTFETGSEASLGYVLAGDIVFGDGPFGYIDSYFPDPITGDSPDLDGGVDPTIAVRDLFDARVEVYDADGVLLAADSDSGFLYDPFAEVRFDADSTYYVRVRSDASSPTEIRNPQVTDPDDPEFFNDVSTGTFELRIQTLATELTLDPETRVVEFDRSSSGRDIDTNVLPETPSLSDIDPAGLIRDQHSAQVFTYETLTTGTNFVNFFFFGDNVDTSALPVAGAGGYVPTLDPTITIFDDSGSVVPIQTNDTLSQGDPFGRTGVRFDANSGERFFIVIDLFDGEFRDTLDAPGDATAGELDYRLVIESAVMLDNSDTDQPVDDHIDLLQVDTDGDDVADTINPIVGDLATPLVWGDAITPRGFIDSDFFFADGDLGGPDPLGVPDGYLFPGLLDPRLYADGNEVFEIEDTSRVVQAFGGGRLDDGADTDVFMFIPQVDMLGSHAGAIDPASGLDGGPPGQVWFPDGRPESRLTVNVFLETEWVQLGSTAIQIFDSNFNLINEQFVNPATDVITGGPPGAFLPIPTGVESPALLPPGPETGGNVNQVKAQVAVTLDNQYWGGEAYYLVVSSTGPEARYTVAIQGDAFDEDDTEYAFDTESADEGNFGAAQELVFSNDEGVATNNLNLNDTSDIRQINSLVADVFDEEEEIEDDMGNPIPNPNFNMPDPDGDGYYDAARYISRLGLIHDITDTDLYRFTAQNDGATEILLTTTNITDSFTELFINNALGGFVVDSNTLTKTYDSPLDAAFRVYDSNGEQIAYVDNFLGYSAGGDTLNFPGGAGAIGSVDVQRKDPRLVIDVKRGEQYFVLVESSQRYENNAAAADFGDRDLSERSQGDIDWRRATGSYQLIVNTTPNQTNDDHADFDFGRNFAATVIPFDSDPTSPDNGTGSVSGVIEEQSDRDVFEFLAPTSGIAELTLNPQNGLSLALTLFDGGTQLIPVQPSSAIDGELLTVSFGVTQGERYLIEVRGLNGTGAYDISLSGLPVADDLSDEGRYFDATELSFNTFDRTITTSATFEQAGDTELYSFVATESDLLTISLSGDTFQGFAGALEIFQLKTDPGSFAPGPGNLGTTLSQFLVSYDLNPERAGDVSRTVSVQEGQTYFVLVRGAPGANATGNYDLTLTYNPDDDHADIGQLEDASFINVIPSEGTGSITGVLEQSSDSDLFVFGAPAAGPVTVTLAWASAPPAAFTLQLFDVNGDALDVNGDGMVDAADTVTGSGGTLGLPAVLASTGDIFYAAVTGATATDIEYTLTVNTGLLDDHANEGDLAAASLIQLSPSTGDGSRTGVLEVDDDTDLFTFAVSDNAEVEVLLSTTEITTPVLQIFDATGALVGSTPIAGGVRFSNTSGADAVFYASVGSTFPGFQSGAYTISVDGPPAPPAPNDDHADEGDFNAATVLAANALTGDASSAGVINVSLDSDLFRYDTVGRGEVFVQVVSLDLPTPDFTVRVFDSAGVELTGLADSAGVPGANGVTAATSFGAAAAAETYFLLVESTGDADIGNYTIRVDGVASTSTVFYPEGFANASIQQFVSLANPNDEAVDFTIRVYYADAMLGDAVVATGTLAAGARGGATLSFGGDIDGDGNADFAPGIVANEAYAIAVESDLRIAAGLSHYDRGILGVAQDPAGLDRSPGAIGEAFTDRLSTTWAFPDVERNPGVVEEFLVYFNPNSFNVDLTVTAFTSAGEVTLSTITLGANRRGGLEIHNTTALPLGTFAVELTAEASDSANEAANLGVVASISRYNLLESTAYGYLGVPDGGSTFNVVASVTEGPSIDSEISLFNSSDSATTVTITGTYQTDQGLPDLTRLVTLAAGQRLTLTGNSLAFVPNTPIGLTISSTNAIAVTSVETQRGDATGVAAFTEAGTAFFFGDAFMNPDQAGALYSEALTLYNPGGSDADVSVTFLFADGTMSRTRMETVGADGFLRLQLEDVAEVVNDRPRLNFFSIQVESDSAIVAQLSHFDGFLGGGWASGGAPLGLVNSIA